LFGGGGAAFKQLGIEVFGILAVVALVFTLSYVTVWVIKAVLGGITVSAVSEAASYESDVPQVQAASTS
jgi:ammonia channel protein AmtB